MVFRQLFKGLYNRCAVCGESYEPELLRDMGKYVMCVVCLEQEEKTHKEKVKTKAKNKKEGVEVEEPQDEAEMFSQNLGEVDVIFND